MIVQSVLPFGDITYTIDIDKNAVINSYFQYRDSITKKSGSSVSTRAFLDPNYSGISGILYSNSNLWNLPPIFGSEFIFIHNPTAQNKIPHKWLPIGNEYWVENDILKWSRGA